MIVVDDGSTDGTGGLAEDLGLERVRVLHEANRGKPGALNLGIAAARHDLIVTVDADTVFEPGTLRRLVQPFRDERRRRRRRQHQGRQPPGDPRPLAAHRLRDGLQPRPPPL